MPVSPRKSIGRKRFMSLIKHLETLKEPETFDYSRWGIGEVLVRAKKLKTFTDPENKLGYDDDDGYEYAETNVHGSCGTTGCVLGHAAFMPEFRKLGLRLVALLDKHDTKVAVAAKHRHPRFSADLVMINRKREITSADASSIAGEIFGIDYGRAQILFFPGACGISPHETASAKEVAKFLRKQVEEIDDEEGWAI